MGKKMWKTVTFIPKKRSVLINNLKKVSEKEKIDKAYSTYLNPIKFQKLYEMSLNEFILASELLYKMTEYNQILD